MATKKKTIKPEDVDEVQKQEATAADGVVLVNREKVLRAQDILALITGKRAPADESELDRKNKFASFLTEASVTPTSKGALQFIYEKLGGLVRTPEEQDDAEETAKEMQKKNKRRAIEADK